MTVEEGLPTHTAKVKRIEEAIAWVKIAMWNGEPYFILTGSLFYVQGPRDYKDCPLSARELDVLELVADGLTNRDIGTLLDLSHMTIKSHLARIAKRLQVTGDRSGLVAFAMRAGWIE